MYDLSLVYSTLNEVNHISISVSRLALGSDDVVSSGAELFIALKYSFAHIFYKNFKQRFNFLRKSNLILKLKEYLPLVHCAKLNKKDM